MKRLGLISGIISLFFICLTSGATAYDLEQDYSTSANPAGAWSYGSKATVGGAFNLFTSHSFTADGLDFWGGGPPSVYHNGTSNTVVSNEGQGTYPPGTVWMGPGAQSYSAIRFTAPLSGLYDLRVAVKSVLDGNLSTDADFHVVRNGTEIFGQNVPPTAGTGYTNNNIELASGDTIDFLTGRGADNNVGGSGLKIKAQLNLVEEHITAPEIVQEPADAIVMAGSSASFSVQVQGSAPLQYRWFFNGNPMTNANFTTLTLNNVQPSQSGGYRVRISNAAGAVTSRVATLTVQLPITHDLERDYSLTSNPAGVWSYGWKGTVGGAFNIFPYHGFTSDGLDFWQKNASGPAAVYHNPQTNAVASFAPGDVAFHPNEGGADNFAVIRFTAPQSGSYELETTVRPFLPAGAGDTDFHVVKNGSELYGVFLAGNAAPTTYSNTLGLVAGDTIDFLVGRGADNREYGSALKIKAALTLVETTNVAPVITTQPQSRTARVGDDVEFRVVAAGDPPLQYQWSFNGADMSGATNPSLLLNDVQSGNAGGYSVRVSNAMGSVTSVVATLTVETAITHDLERDYSATSNPAGVWSYGSKATVSGAFNLFTSHSFTAEGLDFWGGGPPSVYHNGTSNTVVSNEGQGTYPPKTVWMGPGAQSYSAIRFTAQVSGLYDLRVAVKSVLDGNLSTDADFHVVHNGSEVFGQNVPPTAGTGYTNSIELAIGDAIDFLTGRGADNNVGGSGLKIKAQVNLLDEHITAPQIVQEPADATVFAGSSVSFSVQAQGSAPLQYQWFYNANQITNANLGTLTLNNVQPSQSGGYRVRISNPAGAVTSRVAILTVQLPSTYDLERDYSPTSNPAGVWSYGWKGDLSGPVNLMTFHFYSPDGIDYWLATANRVPAVYHNGATNTVVSNQGQGRFAPGAVWMGPGTEGTPENYSVIRFSATRSGVYDLKAAVRSVLDGSLSRDADFHILYNGTEIFGENVPGNAGTGYSNRLDVLAGDTIDFVTGRGADGHVEGSGLKIKAYLDLVEGGIGSPVVVQQPVGATVFAGADVNFSVSARGTGPLQYQWLHNGNEIANANAATLTLLGVQPSQSGDYSARVSNITGSVTSAVATLIVESEGTFDLESDYSATSNPAGVWAYGWKGTLGGAFNIFTYHGYTSEGLDFWMKNANGPASVYHNPGINAVGSFAPGDVWFGPGHDGNVDNFSVIRFTALGPGTYSVQATVRPFIPTGAGDTDFHVVKNGSELYGVALPGNAPPTTYSDRVALSSGDTVDFMVGRGADNRESGSALKIKARVILIDGSHECVQPPAGLVAWWPFDGGAEDLAGNNDGTLHGNPVFTVGKVGPALQFDYSDDAMRVAANSSLDVGQGNGFTIEAWIKSDELTVQHPIVEWNNDVGDIGAHFWTSQLGFDGQIASLMANIVDVNGVGHGIRTGPNLLTTDRFYHVALTYDKPSGVASIYINGTRVAETNLGSFTPQTSSHFYVGLRSSGPAAGNRFAGRIDELSLYNRALSGSQIQTIYTADDLGKCKPPPVAPTIIGQPQSQTVAAGGTATFSVTASGTQPLTYQWRRDGVLIPEATHSSLTLNDVQVSQTGAYSVEVSNPAGSVTSQDAILTVTQPTDCAQPPSGLVAWWPFDGTADDVIGGHDGTLLGDPLFGPGRVGQALQFDYHDDAMRVAANLALDVGAGGGFTIEGWIKPDELTVQHPIVEWNDDQGGIGAHFWTSHLGEDGQIASLMANIVDVNDVGHGIRTGPNLLTTDRFYHVALSYDKSSGVASIYIDGSRVAETNLGSFRPQTSSHFYVGLRSSGAAAGNRFAGRIDELSLYNRALNSAEVEAVHAAGNLGKCKPPPLTPAETVAALLQVLIEFELPRQQERPLAASLRVAINAFEHEHVGKGVAALGAFQEKVAKTLLPDYPAQAAALTQGAQMIIDAVGDQ